MRSRNLIISNLRYYWKRNLLLSLGIAISAAVLTGALIVGDSVKYSLNRIVEQRLGKVTMVIGTGDRFVSSDLSVKLHKELKADVADMLLLDGIAVADGGRKRLNEIQVMGVDSLFDRMTGVESIYGKLSMDEVVISRNIAERLGMAEGDEFLLRITKASLVPLNSPFISDAEKFVSLRVIIAHIAEVDDLGKFNLKNTQTAPYNLFISKSRLQDLMDLGERSNLILISNDNSLSEGEVQKAITHVWKLDDAGLQIRESSSEATWEVVSERVFMDDVISDLLEGTGTGGQPLLTYFVNSINYETRSTPYSFVSTLPNIWLKKDEMIINTWLSEDLGVSSGDSLWLEYFIMGPLRELKVDSSRFLIKSIVDINGYFADQTLMPDLPGLSDAGNCRDWETGVPIKLESIRDNDEAYWTVYKGTPKAFVALCTAEKLWQNRFGKYTAFRYPMGENSKEGLERSILGSLDPSDLGITIKPVLSQAEYAAENGVDFSGLFTGLSFFLLVGGIVLIMLLVLLSAEERKEQVRTILVMGIPLRMVRRLLMIENMIVSVFGALLGLILAILYNRLVFSAINGVWSDIIRTEMMSIDIRSGSLLTGFLLTLLVAWVALFFPLNRFLKRRIQNHKIKVSESDGAGAKVYIMSGSVMGLGGIALILTQFLSGEIVNPEIFFAAGGLLLLGGMLLSFAWLKKGKIYKGRELDLRGLSTKNARRNLTRSMTIIILFAIGSFLVISTGSNKKDLHVNAEDLSSGTGGFLYYAESTVPVLRDLNKGVVQYELGLPENTLYAQLRISDGDDASCLNLNKVSNPRILGVDPGRLTGRFSFITSTPLLDQADPWKTLLMDLPGGLIPAVADETVIKWGLGLSVGDTLSYIDAKGQEMNLLLVGGLAPSIFQGNVLISNSHFLNHFPQHSGTEVVLVAGSIQDTASINAELNMSMRDYGWSMTKTATRLAEFNSVTNTYLSIFMVMGALGLLLGTVGLAIVLYRSIIERRAEIALLTAVGYGINKIKIVVIREYMSLFIVGSIIGFIASIAATLPSILSPNAEVSFFTIIFVMASMVVNGWFWIWLLTGAGLKNRSLYSALREE